MLSEEIAEVRGLIAEVTSLKSLIWPLTIHSRSANQNVNLEAN
jgi:hypothetical protein